MSKFENDLHFALPNMSAGTNSWPSFVPVEQNFDVFCSCKYKTFVVKTIFLMNKSAKILSRLIPYGTLFRFLYFAHLLLFLYVCLSLSMGSFTLESVLFLVLSTSSSKCPFLFSCFICNFSI